MDGVGGGVASQTDAVMMIPTPDNSMNDDSQESRPYPLSKDSEYRQSNYTPISLENSQMPSSPPRQYVLPPLSSPISTIPTAAPATAAPAIPSWSHSKLSSASVAPSNPFYSSTSAFRASTPPISSSSEQSPVVSPAKRFSSSE